jgi:hypothetical protein
LAGGSMNVVVAEPGVGDEAKHTQPGQPQSQAEGLSRSLSVQLFEGCWRGVAGQRRL